MSEPPVIETERLVLRPVREDDAEAVFRGYAADPEVVRYVVWRPHRSIEGTREFVRGLVESASDPTRLHWALTVRGDDTLRGMVALRVNDFKANAGYVLGREFWGRGYTTEAMRAVVRFAFGLPGVYRVWALCDADNRASARVMEKCGMQFEGVLRRYVLHPNLSPEPRDARCYAVVREDDQSPTALTPGGETLTEARTAAGARASEKLIVALDVETAREAVRLADALGEAAVTLKVGSQLFTAEGPRLVRELIAGGAKIFLDLKFHDIPNTVAAASRGAVRLGVSIFNVHAAGGSEMMRRAAEATAEESARLGVAPPLLIAVTVLTSADEGVLTETGVAAANVEAQVRSLARLAAGSGLGGVVASPHEIGPVREAVGGRAGFVVVTPGVRPAAVPRDDQRRVMTPAEAVRAGADYVVVGRAILNAPDPARAAREVLAEMEQGLRDVT